MAWRRSDRELAATKYAGQQSATDKARAKAAEREQKQAARRRRDHHRNATAVDRAGQDAHDRRDRRIYGD